MAHWDFLDFMIAFTLVLVPATLLLPIVCIILNQRHISIDDLYRQRYIEKYGEREVNAVIGLWHRHAAQINNNSCAACVVVVG